MNKQGENKIEYCDFSWSPVTGCRGPASDNITCPYCYALKIARRFSRTGNGRVLGSYSIQVLDKPYIFGGRIDPYPFGFTPTFHKYRLGEPAKLKKPSRIFVVSMGDLFGDWVPDEWIKQVFDACEAAPQHQYLFLTKNPVGLKYPFFTYFTHNQNWWIGTSVCNQIDTKRANELLNETSLRAHCFLSIEPLLSEIRELPLDSGGIQWVICGQQTGPGALPPKPEWVESIINQCRAAGVPIFIKKPLWQDFKIQELPEGLG